MAKASKTAKQAKPAKVEPEVRENRYLRASRVILEIGTVEDIDLDELAMRAEMSRATAGHCVAAFQGVCEALREAKLLPARPATPKKAPIAPAAPEKAKEPVAAEA